MQKMICMLLIVGLMFLASSHGFAQPVWQLGPVSQRMCSNIQGIMTGEEEIVYILTQLIAGKIDGTAAADVVNKAQEHIRDEFINSLDVIISLQSSGSDLEYARSLLPQIRSTFSACDMKVNTFLTIKQIDKDGLQRVQNACRVAPENLYNSYCQPPSASECTERGTRAGEALWRKFEFSANLCEKLPDISAALQEQLIARAASTCDDAFNKALSEYVAQQMKQMKAECRNRIPTPTPVTPPPTPVPAPTISSYNVRPGTNQMYATLSNGQTLPVPANIPGYNGTSGFWLDGDFNGDGTTDLLHMVTNGVATPDYCHVHYLDPKGNFRHPTTFHFPCAANPQCGYNIALGYWVTRDLDGDGRKDLLHDPKLPDNRRHCWISLGNGDFQLQACP